jgi:hypothetical protein
MKNDRSMYECDVELVVCPYCQKDVIVFVELDGSGVISHESYDLIANWIYHSACWDEQMRRFPPGNGGKDDEADFQI